MRSKRFGTRSGVSAKQRAVIIGAIIALPVIAMVLIALPSGDRSVDSARPRVDSPPQTGPVPTVESARQVDED